MDRLSDPNGRAAYIAASLEAAAAGLGKRTVGAAALNSVGASGPRSQVRSDVPVPTPPFWGAKATKRIRLEDVAAHLDHNALFRLQWGAKNAKGAEWEALKAEYETRLRDMVRSAERDGWLEPQVAYGYFPVQSAGQELVVYDPASVQSGAPRELTRFSFPRQIEREHLCLADYFRSVESGTFDLGVFQLVTVGPRANELSNQLQAQGDYSQGYYVHGLAVSMAEALAEYTNQIVRQSLGLGEGRGRRYSWGYPACPDLAEHTKLFAILPAEQIGMSLTEAYQLLPEQSTAALVVHHPEAKYFSIGSAE